MESESSKDDLRAFNMTRTYYQNCMRKYEYEQGFNAGRDF